jgi:hypothetical protein
MLNNTLGKENKSSLIHTDLCSSFDRDKNEEYKKQALSSQMRTVGSG